MQQSANVHDIGPSDGPVAALPAYPQCPVQQRPGSGHTLARDMKAGSGGPPLDSGFDSLELAADHGTSGGQLSIYTLGRGS